MTSRSVLITGGNGGIGLAVARALADDDDRVTVASRSGKAPAGMLGVRCDVGDADELAAAIGDVERQQGPVDVLVAAAGITDDKPLLRMDEDSMRAVLDTNLLGTYRAVRLVAKGMLVRERGRIVLISSALGFLGSPGQTNYAASKTALVGLARSMAWEFGSRNVTINVVAPGIIETAMTRDLSERRHAHLMEATPMRRPGKPDEVAVAVRFLTSDNASYITGAVLPVSGGIGMGM